MHHKVIALLSKPCPNLFLLISARAWIIVSSNFLIYFMHLVPQNACLLSPTMPTCSRPSLERERERATAISHWHWCGPYCHQPWRGFMYVTGEDTWLCPVFAGLHLTACQALLTNRQHPVSFNCNFKGFNRIIFDNGDWCVSRLAASGCGGCQVGITATKWLDCGLVGERGRLTTNQSD